ncbi:hypothetical protein KKB40_03160 [Patescibacteria group bacterium]|nr:hypothetical protein [Patescibacteria group bacterium]
MKTTLQVPVEKSLKTLSTEVAKEYGFSSLQEAVRIFLAQLANRTVTIRLVSSEADEMLSSKQEAVLTKKYLQTKADVEKGKGFVAKNAEEFIDHLRSA